MSKIHVLAADNNGNYNIVLHVAVPVGNNSVGVSWQTAGLNSGLTGHTVMTVGTGAGQISSSENTSVLSGSVVEIVANIPAESGGATVASLNLIADIIITQVLANLAKQLKYFGYTQG